MLVPDYTKPQYIIYEGASDGIRNYYPRKYYDGLAGDKYLSSHLDQQYYTAIAFVHDIYVGTYFTYTISRPGYIQVIANFDMGWYYNTDTSLLPNQISFQAGIRRSQFSATNIFNFVTPKTSKMYKTSDIIPVAKGDVIYWGTWHEEDGVPANYIITFYPAKSVDAKTGD